MGGRNEGKREMERKGEREKNLSPNTDLQRPSLSAIPARLALGCYMKEARISGTGKDLQVCVHMSYEKGNRPA